jgi:hypothetical protein
MGKKKNKNELELRKPCGVLPDGKCKCKNLWCKKECGYCSRHCTCPKRNPPGDHPMPEKTECKKGANGIALCNYEWCKIHPKLCSKCCKTCAEPKKDVTYVSARPQRERQVANNVDEVDDDADDDVDDETTSQREARKPNDAVKSLGDLCLAFPPTISMNNMPSERRRKQPNAGTVIQGMGNTRRAEQTMVNLMCGIMEKCAEFILPGDPAFVLSGAIEKLQAKHSKPILKKK